MKLLRNPVLGWTILALGVLLMTLYLGSYFYFRAMASGDRLVGGDPWQGLSMTHVGGSTWGTAYIYSSSKPSYKPNSFKDPYVGLPKDVEQFLHTVYFPIQFVDCRISGWAVGFKSTTRFR
ncbi:MAG: hypothetical protein AAF226_15455 [Verrucomicrobiota bacterium]